MLSLILDRLSYLNPFTGSSISLIMQKVRVSAQTEDYSHETLVLFKLYVTAAVFTNDRATYST